MRRSEYKENEALLATIKERYESDQFTHLSARVKDDILWLIRLLDEVLLDAHKYHSIIRLLDVDGELDDELA